MNPIETVFEWLLAATLRASVLAVAILGIQFLVRRWLPAGWRHALWLPMLAVLVLPALPQLPFALFPHPAPAPVAVTDILPLHTDSAASVIATAPLTAPASAPDVAAKLNVFALAWLAGACGVLAAGMIGYRRNMRRIRMSATSPDPMLQSAIDDAAREIGLKHAPQTLISPAVTSPAVTGLIRPLLLLPANFPGELSKSEARLILLHEFTHLKRYDLPLNWLTCVLQALHWFNPLLWFAFARMRADRETACDARVLSIDATDRRAEYGGALLKLQCVTPSRALSLGFVGIFERGSEIQSRIREISAFQPGHIGGQATGGVIVALLMILGVAMGQETRQPAAGKDIANEIDPALPINEPAKELILKKLNSIIIPMINFEDTTVEEAIDFLRLRSMELDPEERGVNFVIRHQRPAPAEDTVEPPLKIRELRLRDVPLGRLIQYICDETHLSYTVDDTAVILAPKNEASARGKSLSELLKAVADQEAKVEERRKVLSTIVRTKGIITGHDPIPNNGGNALNALQTYNQLEQEKMQLESQLHSLLKHNGEQLMVYAAALNLPDNPVRQLHPKYLEAKRQLEAEKARGLGDGHPTIKIKSEQVDAMRRDLDQGVVKLRATLKAQIELASDRLKRLEAMKDGSREEALKRGLDAQDYVDAKRELETEQELLQQMKLKLLDEKKNE